MPSPSGRPPAAASAGAAAGTLKTQHILTSMTIPVYTLAVLQQAVLISTLLLLVLC
jgi:hypothetical protein